MAPLREPYHPFWPLIAAVAAVVASTVVAAVAASAASVAFLVAAVVQGVAPIPSDVAAFPDLVVLAAALFFPSHHTPYKFPNVEYGLFPPHRA